MNRTHENKEDVCNEQHQKTTQTINKIVLLTTITILIAVTLGNTLAVFKGEKPVSIATFLFLLCIFTCTYLILMYRREPHSEKIKIHAYALFSIIYIYSLFTSDKHTVFIYVVPIIYLYTMYYDIKLMKIIVGIFAIANVLAMINLYLRGINSSSSIIYYVVQIMSVTVICITSILLTTLTKKINDENMKILLDSSKQQETILDEVLSIGSILDKRSKDTFHIVSDLQDSSSQMEEFMKCMTNTMDKTKTIMDNQITLTEDIQNIIVNTSNKTGDMSSLSKESILKIKDGVNIVNHLTENTTRLNESSKSMSTSMYALQEKMKEIDQITDVINSIATQINLLSLNASIESARAGEAGRGFSVVAKEIGNLASQTSSSVDGISQIISDLQVSLENAVTSVQTSFDINEEQNKLIHETEFTFNQIAENMQTVNQMVFDVSDEVKSILMTNDRITENINLLFNESTNSQENILSTSDAISKVQMQIEETKYIADELLETSERLQVYM